MTDSITPEDTNPSIHNTELLNEAALTSQDRESDLDFSQQFRNETSHEPADYNDILDLSESDSEDDHHNMPIDSEFFRFQLPPLLPDMFTTTLEDANSNLFSSLLEDDAQFINDLGEVIDYDPDLPSEIVKSDEENNSTPSEGIEQGSAPGATDDVGLPNWKYSASHAHINVDIDSVDQTLGVHFVRTGNAVLDRVICELNVDSLDDITRLDIVQTFLPHSMLQHLAAHSNGILRKKSKPLTSPNEILGLLVLHILCASYGESPTTILSRNESKCFLQLSIKPAQCKEVWATFPCTMKAKQRVSHNEDHLEWEVLPEEANQLLLWMERSIADVNRSLIALSGAKLYSLDDDHIRQSSKVVTEMTYLSINNPANAFGPVQNAICCPLTSLYLAGHFTRKGDKLNDIREVLSMRVQGAATRGSLKRDADVIYAADRGYNCGKTIEFVNECLGATLLGTHKRSLDYPFVFGEGPLAKKHKGVSVSEKGSRSVYSAVKRNYSSSPRALEAFVYRESVGGRIAPMIHNNKRLFGSDNYTVILKNGLRGLDDKEISKKVEERQTIFRHERNRSSTISTTEDIENSESSSAQREYITHEGKEMIDNILRSVRMLTFLQSEDPTWFLLRAFRFTSTTAHTVTAWIARCFEANTKAVIQAVKCVSDGDDHLPGQSVPVADTLEN